MLKVSKKSGIFYAVISKLVKILIFILDRIASISLLGIYNCYDIHRVYAEKEG